MADRTIQCDCGHGSTPGPEPGKSGAVGYATTRESRTLCYSCANEVEREYRDRSWTMGGYLSDSDLSVITTWTGGVLARVTSRYLGSAGCGRRSIHVRARDERGAEWYGWRSDAGWGQCITLHRRKATPPRIASE